MNTKKIHEKKDASRDFFYEPPAKSKFDESVELECLPHRYEAEINARSDEKLASVRKT